MAASTVRVHCNQCQRKTLHELLHKAVNKDLEDDGLEWTVTFEMLQCCGCNDVVLRRTLESDPPWDDSVTYFPPFASRRIPIWTYAASFPKSVRGLLQEVYRSLDAESLRLPMMGARALIDMVMVDKVGDSGTFADKLKQLEPGIISSQQREVLDAAFDAGSAAAHRGHIPTPHDVNAVMDIVESLLHSLYVAPGLAERLREHTPPRLGKSKIKPVSNLTH